MIFIDFLMLYFISTSDYPEKCNEETKGTPGKDKKVKLLFTFQFSIMILYQSIFEEQTCISFL